MLLNVFLCFFVLGGGGCGKNEKKKDVLPCPTLLSDRFFGTMNSPEGQDMLKASLAFHYFLNVCQTERAHLCHQKHPSQRKNGSYLHL